VRLHSPETQLYYRDVYDHTIRIVSRWTRADLLPRPRDVSVTTSNRLNTVRSSFRSCHDRAAVDRDRGIFGMNFSQMPFTHNPYGFYGALVVMA